MITGNLKHNRKPIRLDATCYAQPGAICSVTIAVQNRQPIFGNPVIARAALDILHRHAEKTAVPVYGYCVMPDHIHLVIEPSPICDIITFVGQFKNLVQRAAWSLGAQGAFWQKRFWDHFLRSEEQVEEVVQYVLDNPVRRGLACQWLGYPFSGSRVFAVRRGSGGQAPALQNGLASAGVIGNPSRASNSKNGVTV